MNKTKELVFASCKDINGAIEYIAAYSEEEIEVYCENGVLRPEKEILQEKVKLITRFKRILKEEKLYFTDLVFLFTIFVILPWFIFFVLL